MTTERPLSAASEATAAFVDYLMYLGPDHLSRIDQAQMQRLDRLEQDIANAIRAEATADARASALAEVARLRTLLWLMHGHPESLYGDDGERQCARCPLDFKRDPIDRIDMVLLAVASAALAPEAQS